MNRLYIKALKNFIRKNIKINLVVSFLCRSFELYEIVNKLSNYMKSDKNTTQEKTKFNSYVWAGQCIYNIVKREVTEKVQTKQDKK